MTNTLQHRLTTLLCAIALFIATPAAAQTTAKQLFDKAAATVGYEGGVSASFSMSGSGSVKGNIIIKGNKFKATTSGLTIWYDGQTQWTYLKQTEEVNITTPAEQAALNPYKIINLYKQGYDISYTKSGNNYQLHMTAQTAKHSIKEAYVTLNANYEPTQIKAQTADGWTIVNISGFKKGNFSDATFRFNRADYPNAEIVDLR